VARFKRYLPQLLVLPVLVFTLALGITLVQTNQAVKRSKAATSCTGKLFLQVSYDKINKSARAILPKGVPTRYYLHVNNSNGSVCSGNFDVYACSEPYDSRYPTTPGTTCNLSANWRTYAPWGTYRSNASGIARIDWDKWSSSNTNRVFWMKIRPAGTNYEWSNLVSQYVNGPTPVSNIDTTSYWNSQPGYIWVYKNTNNISDITPPGPLLTRIQVEEPTQVCNNGIISTPWRITKNHPNAYWDFYPRRSLTSQMNERWMMVSPNYSYAPEPNFNKYFYMIGDKRYTWSNPVTDYRDINFSSPAGGYLFSTRGLHNPKVPAYNYLPKFVAPGYLDIFENESFYTSAHNYNTVGCNMVNSSATYYSGWKTRIEMDKIDIPGHPEYSGEVLRMDNYEGGEKGGSLATTKNLLRESWYFKKGIGLVKVVAKHFNGYPGSPNSAYCKDTSDCWDDNISSPTLVMTLDRHFQNPVLAVKLSSDGATWQDNIVISRTKNYYLKTTPPYTGYLEALNFQNKVHKWLWVENGLVKDPTNFSTWPVNTRFKANFRVWVPNEAIVSETRVGDTGINWSNEVSFTFTQ